MQNGTDRIYQDLFGTHWEEGKRHEGENLAALQAEERRRQRELKLGAEKRAERMKVSMTGSGVFKDDWDPRL